MAMGQKIKIKKLRQKKLNCDAQVIFGCHSFDHVSDLWKKLGWLSLHCVWSPNSCYRTQGYTKQQTWGTGSPVRQKRRYPGEKLGKAAFSIFRDRGWKRAGGGSVIELLFCSVLLNCLPSPRLPPQAPAVSAGSHSLCPLLESRDSAAKQSIVMTSATECWVGRSGGCCK